MGPRRLLLPSLLLSMACSVANADRAVVPPPPAPSQIALGIAPAKIRAPYDVQVLRENGEALPTFTQRDRFYVQGNVGERYVIPAAPEDDPDGAPAPGPASDGTGEEAHDRGSR